MAELPESISETYAESLSTRHKLWTTQRPFPGVYLEGKPTTEKVDTNGIDVIIVLLRALRSYGWLCQEPRTIYEKALCKIVDMNLGWSDRKDRQAKKEVMTTLMGDFSRESVERLRCENVNDEVIGQLIVNNKMFQFIDEKALLRSGEGAPWAWTNAAKLLHVSFMDGTKSVQEHMNDIFKTNTRVGRSGERISSRRLERLVEFIYIEYSPVQVRKFEELAKFDLKTIIRTEEDGEVVFHFQDIRYHILAIVNMLEGGPDDIRIYDRVNSEIEEHEGAFFKEKMENRAVVPHWTVETAGNDACFKLFYYQVLEPRDSPVNRWNVPCAPVEFHKRKDQAVKGTETLAARLDAGDLVASGEPQASVSSPLVAPSLLEAGQEAIVVAESSTVRDSVGQARPNPRDRFKGQLGQYEVTAPVSRSSEGSRFGTNILPPSMPRAMLNSRGGASRGQRARRRGGHNLRRKVRNHNRDNAYTRGSRGYHDNSRPDIKPEEVSQRGTMETFGSIFPIAPNASLQQTARGGQIPVSTRGRVSVFNPRPLAASFNLETSATKLERSSTKKENE